MDVWILNNHKADFNDLADFRPNHSKKTILVYVLEARDRLTEGLHDFQKDYLLASADVQRDMVVDKDGEDEVEEEIVTGKEKNGNVREKK